jgi:Domain of unknown function (DUF4333)
MNVIPARLKSLGAGATATLSGLALLGLAAMLAGCGVKLDMDAVGKSISTGIASQVGLEVASVTCPQEAPPAKAGDTFECVAIPKEGGKLTVKVTQKDDKGNVDWEVEKSEGLINLQTVEQAVAKGIKEQTEADSTVSCGGAKFRGVKPGETFDCEATAPDGTKSTVTVTEKDAEGNISWALK